MINLVDIYTTYFTTCLTLKQHSFVPVCVKTSSKCVCFGKMIMFRYTNGFKLEIKVQFH